MALSKSLSAAASPITTDGHERKDFLYPYYIPAWNSLQFINADELSHQLAIR